MVHTGLGTAGVVLCCVINGTAAYWPGFDKHNNIATQYQGTKLYGTTLNKVGCSFTRLNGILAKDLSKEWFVGGA